MLGGCWILVENIGTFDGGCSDAFIKFPKFANFLTILNSKSIRNTSVNKVINTIKKFYYFVVTPFKFTSFIMKSLLLLPELYFNFSVNVFGKQNFVQIQAIYIQSSLNSMVFNFIFIQFEFYFSSPHLIHLYFGTIIPYCFKNLVCRLSEVVMLGDFTK